MKNFVVGSRVYHCDKDNGNYEFGTISEIHTDENGNPVEADLDLTNGGNISPVLLADCEIVSEDLFEYGAGLETFISEFCEMAGRLGMVHRDA